MLIHKLVEKLNQTKLSYPQLYKVFQCLVNSSIVADVPWQGYDESCNNYTHTQVQGMKLEYDIKDTVESIVIQQFSKQ